MSFQICGFATNKHDCGATCFGPVHYSYMTAITIHSLFHLYQPRRRERLWRDTGGKIPSLSPLDAENQSGFMGSILRSFEVLLQHSLGISCWKENDHFCGTTFPLIHCNPLHSCFGAVLWTWQIKERERRVDSNGGACVWDRVCVKEHQRNPGKVSSHLQLHPFVFPQLLSFPSCLCIYSNQSSSMLASSVSALFQAQCRFGEMKCVPFTSPW